MLDVVTGQVEAAVELLPSAAVVVDLKPDLPFTSVEAGQELGKPGEVDVGASVSEALPITLGRCHTERQGASVSSVF